MIALFKNKPYDFSPGTKWNYSNSGYYLLGVIVEKVSGKKFTDYLQQEELTKQVLQKHVHGPAGFRFDSAQRDIPKQDGHGTMRCLFPWKALTVQVPCSLHPDLVTWTKALHENQILSPHLPKR